MDNMQETINSILSDPAAMDRIKELGKSLGLTGNNTESNHTPAPSEPKAENVGTSSPDLSSLSGLLSGISSSQNESSASFPDPNTLSALSKFLPLLSGMNREDETTKLLYALRPFLSDNKRKRLDEAEKLLKIMRVLPMIRSAGIF